MNVIPPITITDALLTSSTIAEPDTGEAVYSAGTTYGLGAVVISTTTHLKYTSLQAGNLGHPLSAAIAQGVVPTAADWWVMSGPTNKWAMFDLMRSTASIAPLALTAVVTPGVRVDALGLHGLAADAVLVTVNPAAPETGTAQAGAAQSLTLAAAASTVPDAYVGMVARIISGTGSGQLRNVVASRYNWKTYSEDLTQDIIYLQNVTNTATQVSLNTVNASYIYLGTSVSRPIGTRYSALVLLSAGTKSNVFLRVAGNLNGINSVGVNLALTATPTWYQIDMVAGGTVAQGYSLGIDNRSAAGASDTGAGTVNVWAIHLEDTTSLSVIGSLNYVKTVGIAAVGAVTDTPWSSNLLTYSQQFDIGSWYKSSATVTANAAIAPDGTLTADKLVEAAANSEHGIYKAIANAAGSVTVSCYAKAAERSWVQVFDGSSAHRAWFNLATGMVGTINGGAVCSMVSVGNGWYRCIFTLTEAAGAGYLQCSTATGDAITSYLGDGTSGLYLWGGQGENGAVATPYIATTSAAIALPDATSVYEMDVYAHTETLAGRDSLALFDLPPYSTSIITLTLTAASGNVECGAFDLGVYQYIGETDYNAESDVMNFSTITRNVDGSLSVMTPRPNVPKIIANLVIDKSYLNAVRTLREALAGLPATWAGVTDNSDGFCETLLIHGKYNVFRLTMDMPRQATIALEVEEI